MIQPQIAVLDAGGQYTHLITRKVRELGVLAKILPSDTTPEILQSYRGVILSGGPASVYDESSPKAADDLFEISIPLLGICYGQQVIANRLGGSVKAGKVGEYGPAELSVVTDSDLLAGLNLTEPVWMSHRDAVVSAPSGFAVLATTATCAVAAMADPARKLYGVQFHPEVAHTAKGERILSNFVFGICGCEKNWDASQQIAEIEEGIRAAAAGRRVLFFVSGGVDSTVAYVLALRALGTERVRGFFVDTGLMREGETEEVQGIFDGLGASGFQVFHGRRRFLSALEGLVDPERKRHAIGEEFVRVQEDILDGGGFLAGDWMLGQGTIYPDTIESGGSLQADLIKTHHNRVEGVQRLIAEGRVLEPLQLFYKDEVRAIGRRLALSAHFLDRHPFPGPGLAIRCLCSASEEAPVRLGPGWKIPISTVGVQGDARTYRHVLSLELGEASTALKRAAEAVNQFDEINRAVIPLNGEPDWPRCKLWRAFLTQERIDLVRKIDGIVRRRTEQVNFDTSVWQFPVVLIPFGPEDRPESVVLRPVRSADGMTADAVIPPAELVEAIALDLRQLPVSSLFVDLTHKPPGTIEWE